SWMDKVARIKDPPTLKKHAGEIGNNMGMVKYKYSENIPSFSNNKVENIKAKRVQINEQKFRVELWRSLMMKLYVMCDLIIEARRADKDRISKLVKCLFKKVNL
ncbi:15941_t:CDS:1, partial [Gigaspora rosea]